MYGQCKWFSRKDRQRRDRIRDRDIHDVVIRNVVAYSALRYLLRLLPVHSRIYNVVNRNPDAPLMMIMREDPMENVATSNLVTVAK